jgi:hypothetical protein
MSMLIGILSTPHTVVAIELVQKRLHSFMKNGEIEAAYIGALKSDWFNFHRLAI